MFQLSSTLLIRCNTLFEATTPMRNKRKDGFLLKGYEDLVVIGISVSWGAKDAYFVSLQQELVDTGRKFDTSNVSIQRCQLDIFTKLECCMKHLRKKHCFLPMSQSKQNLHSLLNWCQISKRKIDFTVAGDATVGLLKYN